MRIAKKPERCAPAVLRMMLELVMYAVPIHVIRSWTPEEAAQVEEWAAKTHLRAADNAVRVPTRPKILDGYEWKRADRSRGDVFDLAPGPARRRKVEARRS